MNDTTSPAAGPAPEAGAQDAATHPHQEQPASGQASPEQPSPYGGYTPPAPMLESEARTISMLIHILAAVAALLSAGMLAFVVPLVMWLIYRERSALVDHHGRLNLNLQLTALTVAVGGVVLGIVTWGIGLLVTIPLMIGYGIYMLVMSIIAGVRANNGEYYRIPLVIPFVR